MDIRTLSKKLGLDTSTLTRNVQKLEKLNLLKRTTDSFDKRIQSIFLSDTGNEIVKKLDNSLSITIDQLMKKIDISNHEIILEGLSILEWGMDQFRNE